MILSAIIITKNEEKNIKKCLESIKDIVDEIIIVDSYSDDRTIEIAKRYTNKIFLKKFNRDFSEQRNFALKKTKGDWIISIDADETLSMRLKKNIPNLVRSKKYLGYLIPRRNYINDKVWLKHGCFYPDYQLRLFKKNGVFFIRKIDEYPNIDHRYIKKIKYYLIHHYSRTKYDKFSSIFKAKNFLDIKSDELLMQNKSILYYLVCGFYLFFRYFFNCYIRGKGFLDGYNGLRAAIIFSSFPLLSSFFTIFKKINLKKNNK